MPAETLETATSQDGTQSDGSTSTQIAAQPAPEIDLTQFIEKEGLLKEGWIDAYAPEDMRHENVYKKVSSIQDLTKQVGVLDRMVGKKGIIIPDPKTATSSDIDAFQMALGRPEKVDDYKAEFPDEFKDFYDPDTIKDFKQFAFKKGLKQEDFQDILNYKMEMDRRDIEWMEQDIENEKRETEEILKKKWGSAYETRLHLATYMIENNSEGGEYRESLLEKMGNEPIVADFLATIAKKFIESGSLREVEMTQAMTPAEANAKMKEKIAEHQAHAKWRWDNPAGYAREEKEIDDLAKIAASSG